MATESPAHDLAQTVAEISERMSLLVHEEIELAKAEVTDKVTKLLRGIVIGIAAGIFVVVGLLFVLHGFAWLAWWSLPLGNDNLQFFWGFFVVAGVLFILGGFAGYLAARFFKASTPPVPAMAIDEGKKIRKTLMLRKNKNT